MSGDAEATLVARALARDAAAVRALVDALTPVVQARAARVLGKRAGGTTGRSARQELEDMAQEVFVALFANDARALRGWDRARGLSLANYVGLIAEHQVASILRSGRRSPWTDEPTAVDTLSGTIDDASLPEAHVASREAFEAILQRLRAALTPRGLELFYALFVDGASVESVCQTTAMSEDAVYAAKSRILKVLRKVAAEIDADRDSAPTAAAEAARGTS
jgi:RNA polymerase sigma-70 factor (ECF subfamily)